VLLAITNLPALVMDVRLSTFVVLVLLQKVHTVLVHSNVRLPLGPFRRLVGGPEFHRVHHTTGGDRSNYASLLPVLDWIFGTYAEDGRGLCGTAERVSRSWWGQLWLRRR
jgi:sterol desaturase/sphingolipid hydroxylase (fatty acid hydroxylase superfamily)